MEGSVNSKRRRGLGVVTPNACTECRKKRAKCDGNNPCGRCTSQKGTECVYEVPVRQSKEHMRSEIEQLRIQQRQSERILAALVSSDRSEQVLDQLRNGETLETITHKLDHSTSESSGSGGNVTTFSRLSDHQAIGQALKPAKSTASSPTSTLAFSDSSGIPHTLPTGTWPAWGAESSTSIQNEDTDMMRWDPDTGPSPDQGHTYPLIGGWHHQSGSDSDTAIQQARGYGQETILGSPFGMEEDPNQEHPNSNEAWTRVTSDGALVEHLMALYFCWEYPTFASLSKEHFLEDFRTGNQRHCSSLLVNALLAVGCRFSSQASTRADPNDANTSGDHFFAEALRLLGEQPDRHVLTTIQALGLMSIREASCGRSSESLFLSGQSIRLAIEMGLHLDINISHSKESAIEHAVRSATFWGAFSLDQAWSLSIGRLPHFSRDTKLATKPAIVDHVESAAWIPYTDDGAPLERSCTQPSNVRSVYKTFCELSEIIHKSLYTLYSPGTHVTSKALLEAYTHYLNWYDVIPASLRLGHNFTPAVLFAHMYYHYAILLLFRPFIKLDIVGSGVSPRDVCSQAASAISTLVNSYSQLYTLRRTPSFVPYFVLTSSIAHIVTLGNAREGPEQLKKGIADLKEMTGCHGFAIRALDILRYLILHWDVDIEFEDDDEGVAEGAREGGEGGGEGKWRQEMCRPKSTSLNQFCPNVESVDVVNGIGRVVLGDNPLFWPFPLQGRPLLDGRALEIGGFRLVP
ncbi:fungal-specific transcription factor domain-containing protein [Hyaloscypha sp. PMI_1271]|nr:fungal-specific transcription factor domain-containing protein [Hyaloscypha sp. PMI_1271]